MKRTRTSSNRGPRWRPAGLLLVAAALAGCSPVEVVPVDDIRVQIRSAPGVTVHLLTSMNFRTVQQGGSVNIEIGGADAEWRAAPFDSTYDIRGPRRFLVRVLETDVEDAEVEMRVWADGVEQYNRAAVVAQTPMQYIYIGR